MGNITCKILKVEGNWIDVKNACRTTINLGDSDKEPSSEWKDNLLKAEHSPIRRIRVEFLWENMPRFVADHLVRHNIGVDWFMKTDRDDRTNEDRNMKSQTYPTNLRGFANLQALINISRKRLCKQASTETTYAWKILLIELKEVFPEVFSEVFDNCVPECIYRGFCPEMNCCGYINTDDYLYALEHYRGK